MLAYVLLHVFLVVSSSLQESKDQSEIKEVQ